MVTLEYDRVFLPNTNFRQLPLIDERTKHALSSPCQSQYWSRTAGGVRVQWVLHHSVNKGGNKLVKASLVLFVSLYPVERREMCFLRCGMQMRLSAPFAPISPPNPHLTVCVCQRAVKQSGVTGGTSDQERKKERVIVLRDVFPRKQGRGAGREESGSGTARSPLDH